MPRFATKADRHARSLELIKIFDEIFATKDLAEWRKLLDGNGLVFGVVGILDDIPNDQQMIDNEVLVPFEGDTMLTINSPIWVDGSQEGPAAPAARPRRAQGRDAARSRLRRGGDPPIAIVGRGGLTCHASYRLHYFPESGNSYKLALMLTLCGRDVEPVWTDFGGGVTRTPSGGATSTRWAKFRCWKSTASG